MSGGGAGEESEDTENGEASDWDSNNPDGSMRRRSVRALTAFMVERGGPQPFYIVRCYFTRTGAPAALALR